jgi:hypothetical protein
MSFDPSTIPAQLAALQARCDYQQFALIVNVAPVAGQYQSPYAFAAQPNASFLGSSAQHPFQSTFQPRTSSQVVVSWSGVYKGETYFQPALIADASLSTTAQAAVLQAAVDFLNLVDLRLLRDGANPNTYSPT